MDSESRLTTAEMSRECAAVAIDELGHDKRIEFVVADSGEFIQANLERRYDLIFADTWPGKFYLVDETLAMVKPGGLYIVDDLNPQPNWPEGHGAKAEELIAYLESRTDFHLSKLNWATGLILMSRKI